MSHAFFSMEHGGDSVVFLEQSSSENLNSSATTEIFSPFLMTVFLLQNFAAFVKVGSNQTHQLVSCRSNC